MIRRLRSSFPRRFCSTEVGGAIVRFVDKVQIEVKGGRGGNGCVSFEVLSPGKKRPNGGMGGRGGDVYIVADRDLMSLSFQTFHFNAGDGGNGGSDGLTGRNGKNVYIKVPIGTIVSEYVATAAPLNYGDEGDEWDEEESVDAEDEVMEEIGDEDERGIVALETDEYEVINDGEVQYGEGEKGASPPSLVLSSHNETICVVRGGAPGLGTKYNCLKKCKCFNCAIS